MEDEEEVFRLAPKGVIVQSLGGYIKGKDQAEVIAQDLIEYMVNNKVAIIVDKGGLSFVSIYYDDNKTKP